MKICKLAVVAILLLGLGARVGATEKRIRITDLRNQIPDKFLRGCIQEKLEELNEDDVTNITELDCSKFILPNKGEGPSISNLNGIGSLANLRTLDLSRNPIFDIQPLSDLSNLEIVNLRKTNTESIEPLSNLRNLKVIDLEEAYDIKSIEALSSLYDLRELNLNATKVDDINAISNLRNIKILKLSGLSLKDKEQSMGVIGTLRDLEELDITACDFNGKDLTPLSSLSNLKILDMGFNSLPDFSILSNLTQLEVLQAQYLNNSIKPLNIETISDLTNLKEVDLSGDKLSSDDLEILMPLKKIYRLILNGNQINDISLIKDLSELEELQIASNGISDLKYISELTTLKKLNLSYNPLDNIHELSFLINLRELSLINGSLHSLDDLSSLVQLQKLDLEDNPIEDISVLSSLKNLRDLNLTSTSIDTIKPLMGLRHLEILSVSVKNIECSEVKSFLRFHSNATIYGYKNNPFVTQSPYPITKDLIKRYPVCHSWK